MTYLRQLRDSFQARTKTGTPVDGDYAVAPGDGTIAVDTSGNQLFFRAGGSWRALTGGAAGIPFQPQYRTGGYYYTFHGPQTTLSVGLNQLSVLPIWFPAGLALDRIGIEVTTVGTAGAIFRLGIYNDTNGYPGTLLAEYGTVDCATAIGVQQLTISQTIPSSGWYWLGGAVQVATSTLRVVNGPAGPFQPSGGTVPPATTVFIGYYSGGISGALPGTFSSPVAYNALPRPFVRVA